MYNKLYNVIKSTVDNNIDFDNSERELVDRILSDNNFSPYASDEDKRDYARIAIAIKDYLPIGVINSLKSIL